MHYIRNAMVVVALCLCCATQSLSTTPVNEQANTTLEPPSSPLDYPAEPIIAPPPVPEEASAGELLERGFALFHAQNWELSAESFELSIGTGNLNDAGRALSYWHIAECWKRKQDNDRVAEAYHSFIISAQDILDIRERRRFAVTEGQDFVDSFRLVDRLDEARAFMSALWYHRSEDYGRSLSNPITVHNGNEADKVVPFFIEACSSVAAAYDSVCVADRSVLAEGDVPVKPHTERVTVKGAGTVVYTFFIVVLEEK